MLFVSQNLAFVEIVFSERRSISHLILEDLKYKVSKVFLFLRVSVLPGCIFSWNQLLHPVCGWFIAEGLQLFRED